PRRREPECPESEFASGKVYAAESDYAAASAATFKRHALCRSGRSVIWHRGKSKRVDGAAKEKIRERLYTEPDRRGHAVSRSHRSVPEPRGRSTGGDRAFGSGVQGRDDSSMERELRVQGSASRVSGSGFRVSG